MKPYSMDLRERVVAAVEAGASRRSAAARFGVSVASAIRWTDRKQRTGSARPKKMGGYVKPKLLGEREWLAARIAAEPDVTLRGLLAELRERGLDVGYGALWRHFAREGISFKKKPVRQRAGPAGDRPATRAVEEVPGPA